MYLEWRRSWSSCKWPERAIFTTNGVSDHLEATNYFIGNVVDHFGASTSISLAGTKNMVRYREDVGLNKYKALFTRPRPKHDPGVTKLSVSFRENRRSKSISRDRIVNLEKKDLRIKGSDLVYCCRTD